MYLVIMYLCSRMNQVALSQEHGPCSNKGDYNCSVQLPSYGVGNTLYFVNVEIMSQNLLRIGLKMVIHRKVR